MRKLIFLFIFICGAYISNAQTLQFSQILLISDTEEEVPTGKIWKIDGIAAQNVNYTAENKSGAPNLNPGQQIFYINNKAISATQAIGTGGGSGSGSAYYYATLSYSAAATKLPIWLPAGTKLKTGTNVSYLSVIEFEIIQ